MRVITLDRVSRWTQGTGLLAVAALAWAVFVPGGVFWAAVLAAGVVGSALVLVGRRPILSLAQVLASAAADPALVPSRRGNTGGARLRPRGERKP
ncbi:MAG: hypothetical protein PVJ73_13095 [Acidobacteriota bacterium]|jgi:hypothetical protein